MQELTAEWVAKAENDFYAAELLLRGGEFPIPDSSCFHSQQCAEKYLKAWLQEHQIPFERTHHLIPLLTASLKLDGDFETLRSALLKLENFAVGIRYPGANATIKMAEESLLAARQVRVLLREKLGETGR